MPEMWGHWACEGEEVFVYELVKIVDRCLVPIGKGTHTDKDRQS